MSTDTHMCLSIRGALRNGVWKKRSSWSLVGACKKADGTLMTEGEIFNELCDQLAQGHEVIPYGECPNFDWKVGCQCGMKTDEIDASFEVKT
jgi:hypothetical protein